MNRRNLPMNSREHPMVWAIDAYGLTKPTHQGTGPSQQGGRQELEEVALLTKQTPTHSPEDLQPRPISGGGFWWRVIQPGASLSGPVHKPIRGACRLADKTKPACPCLAAVPRRPRPPAAMRWPATSRPRWKMASTIRSPCRNAPKPHAINTSRHRRCCGSSMCPVLFCGRRRARGCARPASALVFLSPIFLARPL
jgi:hypothetical protein